MTKQKQAMALLNEQQYEEAAKLFIEIIEAAPNDPAGYVNFGNVLINMQETEKAANFFNKAIELDPTYATAYFSLGNLLYNETSYTQAITCFKKAMELGLHDGDVYYMLGMALCKEQHFVQALPFLQRATELSADEAVLFQYGLLLAQLEYLDDAEEVLHKVITISPEHTDALYNLGVIQVHKDKTDTARAFFDKVLLHQPTHQLAIDAKAGLAESV